MTVDEAKKIKEKAQNCRNRLLDTRYCEEMSCPSCEYNVTNEEYKQMLDVLREVKNE